MGARTDLGAVTEIGSMQLNLTPNSDEEDSDRLVAVAGIRGSAMLGEGKRRAAQAAELWHEWMTDIMAGLKPLRTVRVAVSCSACIRCRTSGGSLTDQAALLRDGGARRACRGPVLRRS